MIEISTMQKKKKKIMQIEVMYWIMQLSSSHCFFPLNYNMSTYTW